MTLFSRLRHRPHASELAGAGRPAAASAGPPVAGFAVLDVVTTGLSPARERVVEVAVVLVGPDGRAGQRWSATTDPAPVRGSGRPFARIAPELVGLLAGRVLVAHNAEFDLPFLRAELARAGVAMPRAARWCTLQESARHLPDLPRRRLADCCAAAGVPVDEAGGALAQASAAAGLLTWYLSSPALDRDGVQQLLAEAARTRWPALTSATTTTGPCAAVPAPRRAPAVAAPARGAAPSHLSPLLAGLRLAPTVAPAAAAHAELLAATLSAGLLTGAEATALGQLAYGAGLTREQTRATHRDVVLDVARRAVAAGGVAQPERTELLAAAAALGLDLREVRGALAPAAAPAGAPPAPRIPVELPAQRDERRSLSTR